MRSSTRTKKLASKKINKTKSSYEKTMPKIAATKTGNRITLEPPILRQLSHDPMASLTLLLLTFIFIFTVPMLLRSAFQHYSLTTASKEGGGCCGMLTTVDTELEEGDHRNTLVLHGRKSCCMPSNWKCSSTGCERID